MAIDYLSKENIVKIDRNGISISNSGIYGDFATVWKNSNTCNSSPKNPTKFLVQDITITTLNLDYTSDYIAKSIYKCGGALL